MYYIYFIRKINSHEVCIFHKLFSTNDNDKEKDEGQVVTSK